MEIGDLIQYKHDGSRGMVIDIDFTHRNDAPILVLWSPEVSELYRLERTVWWVDLDSVEVTSEG